jgi:hypothetical protein
MEPRRLPASGVALAADAPCIRLRPDGRTTNGGVERLALKPLAPASDRFPNASRATRSTWDPNPCLSPSAPLVVNLVANLIDDNVNDDANDNVWAQRCLSPFARNAAGATPGADKRRISNPPVGAAALAHLRRNG